MSPVAICCFHAAAMLEMADDGEPDPGKRARLRVANAGQANLLREAGKIADQMLAALKQIAELKAEDMYQADPNDTTAAVLARAAIAKAEVKP